MKYNAVLNGFPLIYIDVNISFPSFTNFLGKFYYCPRIGMYNVEWALMVT